MTTAHAICAGEQSDSGPKPELALHLRLARFEAADTGPHRPLEAWVEEQIQHAFAKRNLDDRLPTLKQLRQKFSIRLLLDGLNEVQGVNRDSAQQHLMREAALWSQAGEPPPIFTVRSLDYLPLGTGRPDGQQAGEVDVLPWGPQQIQRYCEQHPDAKVRELWQALQQHPQRAALIELYGNPFNLKLQCDLFVRDKGKIAANRGELMGRIGLLRLNELMREPQNKLPTMPPDVLHSGDPRRVAQQAGQVNGALHRLALQGSMLQNWWNLGRNWHELAGADWAHVPLTDPSWVQTPPAAQSTAQALHLIDEEHGQLRFAHQLWQEYFAAHALAADQPERWPNLVPPPDSGHDLGEGLWQLPQPAPSKWDQCTQLAVQIAADPEPLLRQLTEDNLALAARAAHSRGLGTATGIAPARLREIKHRLLDRSLCPYTPLPLRIEAGELLGLLGDDIRYEEGHGPARAAGQRGPRYLLPKATGEWRSDSGRAHGPGWVEVPAGRLTIQAGNEKVEVEIPPGLTLAFAPVTNAEFKCFVDDGGYGHPEDTEPPVWWQGAAAHEFWRNGLPGFQGREFFEYVRDLWKGMRSDAYVNAPDRAEREQQLLDYYCSGMAPEKARETYAPILNLDDAPFETWLDEQAAPQRHGFEPIYWRNARFANPLQPVVGVSVYEAEAYCRWLSTQTGRNVCLPTEAIWAAAAQGGRCWRWPWADEGKESGVNDTRWHDHINHMHTRTRRTTPVAVFPRGRSPSGLYDLAGQVWEWMGNLFEPTEDGPERLADLRQQQARIDMYDMLARAVRGGSWLNGAQICQPAFRGRFLPGYRDDGLGFRVLSCPIL